MMLNKYAVAFGFVASLVAVPGMALAYGNTISFQGEVADETCEVSVNGNNASPVVLLPTVSASQLNAAGQTAGQTTFDIGVSGCTGDADSMKGFHRICRQSGNQRRQSGQYRYGKKR